MTQTGHCLCGRCGFALEEPPIWTGHCHCESCRRATSSMMTTFVAVHRDKWHWTGEVPATYASTPGLVTRWFCPGCGSQMAFRSERWPEEMHFYAALLEDPAAIEVTEVFHADERLPWPFEPGAT